MKKRFGPISVIIPCYQCLGTLKRAFDSILHQSLQPSEVIIVDDANEDRSKDQLEQMVSPYQLKENWIKIIRLTKRQGPAGARNAGWEHANFPYLAFLDADDAWHPDKLFIQYRWMAENPDIALTGHQSTWMKPGIAPSAPMSEYRVRRIKPASQLIANRFHTRTVMLRREISQRFDPEKTRSEDYLLWLEILFSGLKAAHIDLPLAYTFKAQYGMAGLSADLWGMEKAELDTYFRIYRQGKICYPIFALLTALSLVKYIKRIIVTRLLKE